MGRLKYIFLHGLGQVSSSWKNTISNIDEQSDILCPNLSDLFRDKEISYINLYKSFSEYCKGFSEPLNICGLSLGGIVALQYVIENPTKVNSIVLIGTQFTMPKRLLKLQNMIFYLMPNRMFKQMGFEKIDFINLSKSMMNLDFQQDLKTITCSTLIICGEKDKVNKQASLQLQQQVPHAEVVFIKNAGHEVNIDAPRELGKVLNDFFK